MSIRKKRNEVKVDQSIKSISVASLLGLTNILSFDRKNPSRPSPLRNVLPEPFDVLSHAGNFSISMCVGLGSTCIAASVMNKSMNLSYKSTRQIAFGIGVSAVTFVNLITETKLGVSLVPDDEFLFGTVITPDVIDMVYGVGAGAFAASLVSVQPATYKSSAQQQGYF